MVSEKALKEFKKIWEKEFGTPISDDVATEEASNLLTLFDAIYKPIKKDWVDKSENLNTN